MRYGFDVTSAVKAHGRGIAAYVRALMQVWTDAVPELQPVFYIRNKRWLQKHLLDDLLPDSPRQWMLGNYWRCSKEIMGFHGLGVRLPKSGKIPRSFTLHDLRGLDAVEYTHPRWAALRATRLRETVARADRILCLSEHGRHRLKVHFPDFSLARTAVVPHGLDHAHFAPKSEEEIGTVCENHDICIPYVLQVGRLDRHKNPEASLRAFSMSGLHQEGFGLVFAGGAEVGYAEELQRLAAELGIGAHVHWLGSIAFHELPALYSGAAWVLVPSHYEGFGMPVLEAMACRTAGIVSSGTCLEEVAANVWPAANPACPDEMAGLMQQFRKNPAHLEGIRQNARRHALAFTWERTARNTADFLLQE